MIPIDKVENIVSRFNELENILAKPDLKKDEFVSNSKEYSNLNEIINCAKDYLKVLEDLKSTKNILEDKSTDKEFYEMAEKELKDLKQQEEECVKRLKVFLLPKDEADEKNAIIEIRAGTGGMEAALFAADLFNMYQRVAVLNGWKVEIINLSNSEGGGYKEIIASIVGRNVFSKLKFESGVHRVQRVPDTETQGRIHTSAATVAVLPEAEEVDVKINEADLKIDVFRSSGPGGQSVNTTDSAVRVTHIPSGIVVSQQDEKSQHKNKAKALKILRSKLYDLQRSQQESERAKARKSQIGTGDRSERIRTYNFPQGRVTDHRINMTLYKLTDFLAGDAFKELSDAIQIEFQEELLENLNIKNKTYNE
jgi:peptide chain release factor 1